MHINCAVDESDRIDSFLCVSVTITRWYQSASKAQIFFSTVMLDFEAVVRGYDIILWWGMYLISTSSMAPCSLYLRFSFRMASSMGQRGANSIFDSRLAQNQPLRLSYEVPLFFGSSKGFVVGRVFELGVSDILLNQPITNFNRR